MHPNAAAVASALAEAGAAGEVRELTECARTAAAAATALGCDVAAIANSLVFMADGEAVLILTSGGHRVDTGYVAGQLGVGVLRRASPEQVRAATGQPIGGVAPVGHPSPVRTFVDTALAAYPVVWAAGGTPHRVFPTSYPELLRICAAEPVTVTADETEPAADQANPWLTSQGVEAGPTPTPHRNHTGSVATPGGANRRPTARSETP